jgi:hypothetical protein
MCIECIFESKKHLYKIVLEITGGYASREEIYIRNKSKVRTTWKMIMSRDKSTEKEKNGLRTNASMVVMKDRNLDENAHDILQYWSNIYMNTSNLLTLDTQYISTYRPSSIN